MEKSIDKSGTSNVTKFKVRITDAMRFREIYPEVFTGTKHGWPSCYTCEWKFYGGTLSPNYISIS